MVLKSRIHFHKMPLFFFPTDAFHFDFYAKQEQKL